MDLRHAMENDFQKRKKELNDHFYRNISWKVALKSVTFIFAFSYSDITIVIANVDVDVLLLVM